MNKIEVKLIITRDENQNVSEKQDSWSVSHYKSKSTLCGSEPRYYKLEPNEKYLIHEHLVFDLDNTNYTKDEIKGYVRIAALAYADLFSTGIILKVLDDINKKIDELTI